MDKEPNIVLAGFMGSGKSTVGRIVSLISGRRFIELDRMITDSEGKSIKDIFADHGEERFRQLESKKISEISRAGNAVIAVGGGAVVNPENVKMLKSGGIVYLLKVSAEDVLERIGGDRERPLLGKDRRQIEELLQSREKAYLEAADVIFETEGKEPESLAEDIYSDYRRRCNQPEGSGFGH